mgnify:FL=1
MTQLSNVGSLALLNHFLLVLFELFEMLHHHANTVFALEFGLEALPAICVRFIVESSGRPELLATTVGSTSAR